MNENDLSKIFSALQLFHENAYPTHKKIASISKTSVSICNNTYITALNDVVRVLKISRLTMWYPWIFMKIHHFQALLCFFFHGLAYSETV